MPEPRAGKADHLQAYRAKRSPDRTPEPAGVVARESGAGRLFVVHKHAARRLHFDLRLEMDGVLRSWAVPKGPSYDMADKRLAVHVEDHPLEYGDFEGMIPAGNYGAGGVIVWDRGEWVPLEDPREGLEKGKLLFELKGYKLHGMWTLVKIKKSEKDWLLIKERDAWVSKDAGELPPTSRCSRGLTVEELEAGARPGGADPARAAQARGAAARGRAPRPSQLMLAETADAPFTREDWLFELKLDGYRLLAVRAGGEAQLLTRNGNDYTAAFPEVAARGRRAAVRRASCSTARWWCSTTRGAPSFQRLQGRAQASPRDRHPACDGAMPGHLLRLRPARASRTSTCAACRSPRARRSCSGCCRPPARCDTSSTSRTTARCSTSEAERLGLEGIVGKKARLALQGGPLAASGSRSASAGAADFVVVGFTAPKGSRGGFGALHLGRFRERRR